MATSKKKGNIKSELIMAHPELSDAFIELSAYLAQKGTKREARVFIEDVKEGGLAFSSGIRDSDRLVAIHKTDVKNLSFDEILEAIKCTSVIVLTVERSVKKKNVSIVIALDIGINSGGHPYLNLIGVYWHAIFNDVEKILKCTPTYSFQIAQMDICFYIQMQTKRYYLAVENEDISFTESDGSEVYFTVFTYTAAVNPSRNKIPVILVPNDQPNRCLAANNQNELALANFDEENYTKNKRIRGNQRFLTLNSEPSSAYMIASTVKPAFFFAKTGMKCELKWKKGSMFRNT
ncbi:uncharacterized protein [Apostichopus japonicus]|uniref:uncharacterized protein isoform X1 n=2 Tax=Stichopus japonicus TaxID=307972 RepID=UPI003AB1760C